ncbi:MAG: hypothetical protein ACI38Z_06910 [Parafannyhessea sp.]|uniref:hypothetical protein n=1 Tax=Parafannyhessea sp. TaxID=2847324 RepID=UPI003F0759DD
MQQDQSQGTGTPEAPQPSPEQAQMVPAPTPEPHVIETASATTSPDNANSGAKPVVIAAVGVIVLLLLSSAIGSFVTGFVGYVVDRAYQSEGSGSYYQNDSQDHDQYEDTDDGAYGLGEGAYHAPAGTTSTNHLG